MGCYYAILYIVLFNMILTCKTWPHKPQEHDHKSYSEENWQKRDVVVKDTSTRRVNLDEIPIQFPTEKYQPDRLDYSAENKGYNCIDNVCEDAKDYPYDHIRNILKKVPHYEHLFGYFDGSLIDQGSKVNVEGDVESQPLCATTLQTKYPKTLLNLQNVTKYIINFDNYKQGIAFETCAKNAHCREASFPAGYVAECLQKYSTVRLVAVESDRTKEPALDNFVIPSCCVCSIKKVV